MGISKKKKTHESEPEVFKQHEKIISPDSNLFEVATISDKIQPVIQERPTEEENSSNHRGSTKAENLDTVPTIKTDKSRVREETYGKSTESRVKTSSNRQNGSNISSQRGFARTNSVSNGLQSSRRHSSVQSLTVIREQYCCCSKWTTCERVLGAMVGLMAVIIVILVVVIGILSSNHSESKPYKLSMDFR